MKQRRAFLGASRDRHIVAVAVVVVVQALGAIFFVADAMGDILSEGIGIHVIIESVIAFALLAGVLFGAGQVGRLLTEAQRRDAALAVASGALTDLIDSRFSQWGLTAAEADVALFTLKGCDIAEIAQLRDCAEGTVRAHLTRVYAKANVNSRGALVSLFFEDLLTFRDMPVR